MGSVSSLLSFLDTSPTAWHAVEQIEHRLLQKKFLALDARRTWGLEAGKRYFLGNGGALVAFVVPHQKPVGATLFASHTDSPALKIKPQSQVVKAGALLLGVEVYGAPLLTSWFNRDLGIAGKIVGVNAKGETEAHTVFFTQAPLVIPQLAIHLDRDVNEKGLMINKQEQLYAIAGLEKDFSSSQNYLETIFQKELNGQKLLNFELFLVPLEKAKLVGWQQQLLASYRIDSLVSVHAILEAFLSQLDPWEDQIKMVVFWNHEEIGSTGVFGAASPFLPRILERVCLALGISREEYLAFLDGSRCISVDLGHAVHPTYPEKHEAQHPLFFKQGVVIKSHAQMRYATDASSASWIEAAAYVKQLPLQKFVGRNDIPCGSTVGPIVATSCGIPTVDIGIPQLSMHSARELMCCQDYIDLTQLLSHLLEAMYHTSVSFNRMDA